MRKLKGGYMEFLYAMTLWNMCCFTCPTEFEIKTIPNESIVVVVWSSRDTTTVQKYSHKSNNDGILFVTTNTPREYNEITFRVCNERGCLIYSSATQNVPKKCLSVAMNDFKGGEM